MKDLLRVNTLHTIESIIKILSMLYFIQTRNTHVFQNLIKRFSSQSYIKINEFTN